MSAQRTDGDGRSWTTCLSLRIRRLGVRVPPSALPYSQVKALPPAIDKALTRGLGPFVSHFSVLSDLVDLGERGLALLEVLLARVDVGLLGERRVVMTCPLADNRDRHARVLHECQGRVARVVQGDPPQPGPPEQAAELVGVPLGMDGERQLRR